MLEDGPATEDEDDAINKAIHQTIEAIGAWKMPREKKDKKQTASELIGKVADTWGGKGKTKQANNADRFQTFYEGLGKATGQERNKGGKKG